MLKFFSILFFITYFGISENKSYVKNYHANGILKEEGWMQNGEKSDYWFFYYENGNKKEEGHYKNNQKINWWIYYNDKEVITKKCEYKNNKLNGITIIYAKGEISRAEKYNNGKKVKTWTNYDEFKKDNVFSLN